MQAELITQYVSTAPMQNAVESEECTGYIAVAAAEALTLPSTVQK